ncbi:MAG: STAS domain-containing protein [Deltaproteobacteria bacterium]|nr:STAS domain-containing protein [Deltaproteobacteria bacterium]
MKIDTDKKNGVTVLSVSGNLDAESVACFKKEANKIVEEGCYDLLVDCKSLDFIDSMGLGAMISLLRKVRAHQGDLKVAHLNPDVRQVFEITRLNRLFEILP